MPLTEATTRYPNRSNAPLIDLIENLPLRPGQLDPEDIRKAVEIVVNKRLAEEHARRAAK